MKSSGLLINVRSCGSRTHHIGFFLVLPTKELKPQLQKAFSETSLLPSYSSDKAKKLTIETSNQKKYKNIHKKRKKKQTIFNIIIVGSPKKKNLSFHRLAVKENLKEPKMISTSPDPVITPIIKQRRLKWKGARLPTLLSSHFCEPHLFKAGPP